MSSPYNRYACIASLLGGLFIGGTANAGTLATNVTTSGGCEGIFFDVSAKAKDVHIYGLEAVVVGTDDVSVYYRAGGYSGHESNSIDWTLLRTTPVSGGSGFIDTLYPIDIGNGVNIPAGQTYGFLIWINNAAGSGVKAIRYDSSGLPNVTEDAAIRIDSGMSSCGGSVNDPFDGSPLVRAWRGSVRYLGATEPIPTLSDTGLLLLSGLMGLAALRSRRDRSANNR